MEGRSRIIGLSRLKHGNASPVFLKAKLDLIGSYALQGMWSQVLEHLNACDDLINEVEAVYTNKSSSSSSYDFKRRRAILNARRIRTVYNVLREHVATHYGFVIQDIFIPDLLNNLSEIPIDSDILSFEIESSLPLKSSLRNNTNTTNLSQAISQHHPKNMDIQSLIDSIKNFIQSQLSSYSEEKMISTQHSKNIKARTRPRTAGTTSGRPGSLAPAIWDDFDEKNKLNRSPPVMERKSISWGQLIDFLRNQSEIMKRYCIFQLYLH